MTKEERRAKKQAEYEALSETQRLIYDQKKEIRTVLLFFSLFLVATIVLGYFVVNMYLDVQVARHGTLGEATVVSCTYHSGDEDSDDYYHIKYEYQVGEKWYKGSCNSDYSMAVGSKIDIKHNGGSRSVLANHSTSFILSALPLIIVFTLFSFVEIVWAVGMIGMGRKMTFYKKLDRGECKTAMATYISGYEEGNPRGGKVRYMYEDEDGNMHEGKSLKSYSSTRLKYLQNKGSFEIKYIGKYSVVVEREDTVENKKEELIVAHGLYKCPYCGTILQEGQNECPSCNAQRK